VTSSWSVFIQLSKFCNIKQPTQYTICSMTILDVRYVTFFSEAVVLEALPSPLQTYTWLAVLQNTKWCSWKTIKYSSWNNDTL